RAFSAIGCVLTRGNGWLLGSRLKNTAIASAMMSRATQRSMFSRPFSSTLAQRTFHLHPKQGLSADQIGHQCRQSIVLPLHPVVVDSYVLAFDVAGLAEAFAERAQIARGGIGRKASNKPDHRLRRLLRARRKRPRSRTAKERDEIAAQ